MAIFENRKVFWALWSWGLAIAAVVGILGGARTAVAAPNMGELTVRVVEKGKEEPIAARMHLKDQAGKAVKPPQVPFWRDHFVFDGKIVLELPLGRYTYELECGPEFKMYTGYFLIEKESVDTKTIEMERYVDMKSEGWWSGELHVHRPPAEIELHMRAEDLHIAPVITWWNNRNLWQDQAAPEKLLVQFDKDRFYHLMAGEDEREGGALLYFQLPKPLPIAGSKREFPSPIKFLEQARQTPGVHVDVEKPFWWDMPIWVATGQVDSMGLANNHEHRDGMMDAEAWGKPRDKARFASPLGSGKWSQHIYYQLLNCGLRIPPSAGSASGVLPNPVGYNRVYVHCGKELSWDAWWENLRAGRVVVTNGPMLRPRVHGKGAPREGALPGHVFKVDAGQTVELQVALHLAIREKVDYLEIVKDGRPIEQVRLDEFAKAEGKLPLVKFDKSGWMLVRAVTNNPKTYRFASTGPYYVEIGGERRVSKESARFFLDWVYERARRIMLENPEEQEAVMEHHKRARDFWQKVVEGANAE